MQQERQRQLTMQGWYRFYGLLLGIAIALLITVIWFFNIPGLQDPETGQLPTAAGRALVFFPVIFMAAAAVLLVVLNRESQS